MSRLLIKVRIFGKKNHKFIRFILVPRRLSQKSRYICTLGYWDLRPTPKIRYVVFNVYKYMQYYLRGAKPTRRTLEHLYNYFVDLKHFNNWAYFTYPELVLIIESEIAKKYL